MGSHLEELNSRNPDTIDRRGEKNTLTSFVGPLNRNAATTPMIKAETSNERPRLFNRESKCKTNTLAKRTGNQGNNRDM